MKKIKTIISQYKNYKFSIATKRIIYFFLSRERHKSYGQLNIDKTIYIIRCLNEKSFFFTGPKHNLLANYFYVLTHLRYAKEHGYIPVVDQQNYPVYNSSSEPVNGTMNAWEYFWKQPDCISLEEAYKSKNVILSRRNWFGEYDMGYDASKYTNFDIVRKVNSFCVPLNERTEKYINKIYNELLLNQGRILGVCFRYGGHSKNCHKHGAGHPIQPEINELADIVETKITEWKMDKIFMTSDSIESVDYFKNRFKDKLIIMPRIRQNEGIVYKNLKDNPMYRKQNFFQTSLDYLTEMELLAKCNGLIGSVTSGLRYAVVKNNMQYEHCEILERGFFEDKRKVKK